MILSRTSSGTLAEITYAQSHIDYSCSCYIINKMQNHQQALLVVLSYIIGFITAFIMFGLGDSGKVVVEKYSEQGPRGPYSVIAPKPRLLTENEEGLFVEVDGEQQIISAQTDSDKAELGFHVSIIHSVMSPSLKYAYYCAQMETDSDECQNFIYSVDEHKIYPIKNSTGDVSTNSTDGIFMGTWSSYEDVLYIGGQRTRADLRWELEKNPNASVGYPSDI